MFLSVNFYLYFKYMKTNNSYNFTNIVNYPSKGEVVDMLQNMTCNGDIMLEPRLQEYLRKKKFYTDSDIEPCIPPEKEFLITSADLKLLRAFLRGRRDIYDKEVHTKLTQENNRSSRSSRSNKDKKYFPSREFRDDSRVPNIEKAKKVQEVPVNRGMFAPDRSGRYYEDVVKEESKIMDSRDFPEYVYDGTGFNLNETRFNPRIDPRIEPGDMEKHSKYDSQFRIPPDPYKREVDRDPRNKYIITDLSKKQRREHEHGKNIVPKQDKMFSDYDSMNGYKDYNLIDLDEKLSPQTRYGDDLVPTYSTASEMDLDNKLVIPNMASKSKKDLGIGNYRFETYYSRGNTRDTTLENDLVRGMPSSRPHNRSYGYRNPAENYYDYIDEDFQSADTVEPWTRGGDATRLDNKSPTKNRVYNREVM